MTLHVRTDLAPAARQALACEVLVLAYERSAVRNLIASPAVVETVLGAATAVAREPHVAGVQRPLHEQFQRLASRVEEIAQGFTKSHEADRRVTSEFSALLLAEARGTACEVCPGAHDELCGEFPLARARSAPACLREIIAVFEYALGDAQALYGASGAYVAVPGSLVGLFLSTRSDETDATIGAWCDLSPADPNLCAEVRLDLPLGRLDLAALESLPYILFHELVAHAFQRLGQPKRATPLVDPFGEGLMDQVAKDRLEEARYRPDPALPSLRPAWLRPSVAATEAYVARGAHLHVRQGREAAERLRAACVALDPGSGLSCFHRLVCELNAGPLDFEAKRSLTIRFSSRLPPPGQPPRQLYIPAWNCVAKYLLDDNLGDFVEGILGLK